MKKMLSIVIIAVMLVAGVFLLTGCGDRESTGNNGGTGGTTSGGIKLEDVNTSNWVQAVEDNFGLKLSLPSGWSVMDVSSSNNVNNLDIRFTKGGDETYESFGEKVFEEIKRVATGDITTGISSPKVVNSFSEANSNDMISVKTEVGNDTLKILLNNAEKTLLLAISKY